MSCKRTFSLVHEAYQCSYEQLEDDLHGTKVVCLSNEAEIRYRCALIRLTIRDEANALEEEAKSLREQISSMKQRLEILRKLAGRDNSPEDKNQLTADIASVNDQVPAL
jgi:hypothetical protein